MRQAGPRLDVVTAMSMSAKAAAAASRSWLGPGDRERLEAVVADRNRAQKHVRRAAETAIIVRPKKSESLEETVGHPRLRAACSRFTPPDDYNPVCASLSEQPTT